MTLETSHQSLWMSAFVAVLFSATLVWLLRPVAIRIGLVDHPDSRKAHGRPTPLIGGVAIFLGTLAAAWTFPAAISGFGAYFSAAAILVVVGLVDDWRGLSSAVRFLAQIIASLIMIYLGGVVLVDFGAISPVGNLVTLGVFSVGLTVFSVVGVINATNMVDGLDGLAGSLILVALVSLGWLCFDSGRLGELGLVCVLGAAVLGFLLFNFPIPGRVSASAFMGDAGSMLLGFSIAWLVVSLSQGDGRVMAPVTALWLLVVPLFDTVWLIVKRICTLRWPTQPAADHLHHVFIRAGLKPAAAVGIMWLLAVAGAAFGLAGHHYGIAEHHMFYMFLGVFASYCMAFALVWWRGSLFGRKLAHRSTIAEDALLES